MKKLLLIILLLLLLSGVSFESWAACGTACTQNGRTWTCADCSVDCVQAAINSVSSGDTIEFDDPDDAITWSSTVTVDKAITLKGNGIHITGSQDLQYGLFYITASDNTSIMRITDFTLEANDITDSNNYIIRLACALHKPGGNLRIDHNTFKYGYSQVAGGGWWGVIDNNHFYDGYCFLIFSAGTRAQADESWEDLTPGTGNAMFAEDNHFILDADYPGTVSGDLTDAYQGGKIVFRYNEMDYDDYLYTGADTCGILFHGSAPGGSPGHIYWQDDAESRRSPSIEEVYGNRIHGYWIQNMFTSRGGSSLCYNNSITVTKPGLVPKIYYYEEEYWNKSWSPLRTAWPAEDQVFNSFAWGNTFNGAAQTSANIAVYTGGSESKRIQENRDYFLHAPQATGGKESFTGTNGASGTYPTDGKTYPTLGTMTFSAEGANAYYPYTPYTYPHPLRAFDVQPIMPDAPRNLRLSK